MQKIGFVNKSITAYIFVFLAGIILLAHAVVPHCHHVDKIVIVSECYHDDHETQHHHHDHDDDENCAGCQLKQALFAPGFSSRQIQNSRYSIENKDIVFLIIENDFYGEPLKLVAHIDPVWRYIFNAHPEFNDSELRGPPSA